MSTEVEPLNQIVIAVNGPGEISGWLVPLARRLKAMRPDVRICVALLPCVFRSGAELAVLQKLPMVDAVCSVGESFALILRNRLPAGFRRGGVGVVLHLGGETYLTWAIAKRLRLPCCAYVEDSFPMQGLFDRVFYSGFKAISQRRQARGAAVIGEVMVDAIWDRCPDRDAVDRSQKMVCLYPGSRDYIVRYTLPFMGVIADLVSKALPGVRFAMAKAPYLSMEFLKNLPPVDRSIELEGEPLGWDETEGRRALLTRSGNRIEVMEPDEALPHVSLALTIPGTNTAEAAALGIPIVLILPTWKAETAPLPGLAGHLGRLPLIGKPLKSMIAIGIVRNLGLTAHPNRRAKRMVVPELIGHITASQVAQTIIDLLTSDTRPLEQQLRAIMGARGAANRLAQALLPYVGGGPTPTVTSAVAKSGQNVVMPNDEGSTAAL